MADLDVTYIMDFLIENHVVDNQILEVINSMVSLDEILYLPDMQVKEIFDCNPYAIL